MDICALACTFLLLCGMATYVRAVKNSKAICKYESYTFIHIKQHKQEVGSPRNRGLVPSRAASFVSCRSCSKISNCPPVGMLRACKSSVLMWQAARRLVPRSRNCAVRFVRRTMSSAIPCITRVNTLSTEGDVLCNARHLQRTLKRYNGRRQT